MPRPGAPKQAHLPDKKSLLQTEISHIDITSFDARSIIDKMGQMSFSSRDLSRACAIFNRMLKDRQSTIVLSIAGSTQAAGCMQLYADMIKYNMVDAVVATGASLVDMDFFEACGYKHYRAEKILDDQVLREYYVDRIYDTYIDEVELTLLDHVICDIANELPPVPMTSRGFLAEMGRWLADGHAKKSDSLLELAYKHHVPVFCPAFSDCAAGFGLMQHQIARPKQCVTIDSVGDFRELSQILLESERSGLFIVGGGVPKNFSQDAIIGIEKFGKPPGMHRYAIQVTVADARDGALSGSTLKEACSWGKVDTVYEQMVFAEATTVVPLIVSDAYHRGYWKDRKPRHFSKLFHE